MMYFRRYGQFDRSAFRHIGLFLTVVLASACGGTQIPEGEGDVDSNVEVEDHDGDNSQANSDDESIEPSQEDSAADESHDEDSADPGSDEDASTDLKFDLESIPDLPPLGDGRCGIDFLFIIDNSRSMEDEQKNLIASFPGFIDGIRSTLETDDFQILVVDSDASGSLIPPICVSGICQCVGDVNDDSCCPEACADPGNKTCNMKDCSMYPSNCEVKLGGGKTTSGAGANCGIEGGHRFMLGTQNDLDSTFECAATVGSSGNSQEQMMNAMNSAISTPMVGKGGCNEAFLRSHTVLVVVFITDEEEKLGEGSPGGPKQWFDTLVATKGAVEQVVMIGFFGDVGQAGALCQELNNDTNVGAEASPRLREFVQMFGEWGLASSVCAADYGPAFTEAIAKVDAACDLLPPK
jgi:hypothetical protein